MATVSRSFLLVFLLSLVSLPHFINASLSDACTAAAASSSEINGDFCVTSLQVDPRSGSANHTGLALITIELASKNATSTKAKIQNLLAEPINGNITSTCLELYSDMIDTLSQAANFISSSRYFDAITYLSAALDAPVDCENAFSEKGVKSVLSEEDENAMQLSAIALAFLRV